MKLGNEGEKESAAKKDNDEDDADFERDDDQGEVENVQDDDGGDNKKNTQKLISKVSVKIYTNKGQGKKKKKVKK